MTTSMKTKLPLLIAVATAAAAPVSLAQEEARPPLPPSEPARPPGPPPGERPEGERPTRPEGERRGPGDGERRGPGDGERRGPGDGERRGPGDGERPERPRRDGEAGPRDGEGKSGPPGSPREGERSPGMREGFRRDRQGEGSLPGVSARAQKPTPYLGVSTGPLPAALGAQLNLPEGFGLLVEQVVPDSPAAKAGIQRYDVLKQLNDQQLAAPDQLAALVRSAGKDAEVSVTVVRKGTEQKLTVKVGERLLPEKTAGEGTGFFNWRVEPLRQLPEMARDAARRGEEQARRVQEHIRGFQEKMGDFQKRLQEWQKNPSGTPPEMPKLEAPTPPTPPKPPKPSEPQPPQAAPEPPRPADLLRESRPGGAPSVRMNQDGNVTTWNTAQARIVIKDDRGEIRLRSENGQRFATVMGPQGAVIFDGPVDTEEQRRALPEDARRKLELNGVEALARAESRHGQAMARAAAGEPLPPLPPRGPGGAPDIQ